MQFGPIPRGIRPVVKIERRSAREWRNENPGEGGVSHSAFTADEIIIGGITFPAGTPIDLGCDGHELSRTDGGWQSVPTTVMYGNTVPVKSGGNRWGKLELYC